MNHVLEHKASLNKNKKIEINRWILSDPNAMKRTWRPLEQDRRPRYESNSYAHLIFDKSGKKNTM
jgi:hypothetical protein